ncbi:MAG: Tat pathway signal sequence domain protein [Cyanobacteria bacterium RYN_339]|nr:Tat pathway signal sequence domain protein [Cyanobacteria bacterium RYN_339]
MATNEDSWGLLLRDLVIRVVGVGAVVGGGLWWAGVPVDKWLRTHLTAPKPIAAPVDRPVAKPAADTPPEDELPEDAPAAKAQAPDPTAAPVATPKPAPVATTRPAPVATPAPKKVSHHGVVHAAKRVNNVPIQLVTIDLHDPAVVGTVVLAKDAPHPNTADSTVGDEEFTAMAGRAHAAVAINGTFFSKDDQKRVMGNMVRQGALIKFSQWDHDGTTFWLGRDNRPGMTTPKSEAAPPWQDAWLAMSCGPRLLKGGQPWLQPATEGFRDSHVLGAAGRSALGFDQDRLMLVSFEAAVTLADEANVMKALGCREAMNLDGGASRSLAVGGRVVVPAGRPLTNIMAFYDAKHPAPSAMLGAFRKFKQ